MSMDDLSTLADKIMMSQSAARHDTSRCLPPDVMHVRRTPDVMLVRRTPDVMPARRTPDVMPARRTPDVMPARRTPDVMPARRTPDVMPARRTPDVMPARRSPDVMPARRTPDAMPVQGAAETNTDDFTPVQRTNWYANHNQFHATLESNGLCSYHNNPSSSDLVVANGTSIRTYGEQQVNIRLSGQAYIWTFIIADVRHPLLGADFLSHYSLST